MTVVRDKEQKVHFTVPCIMCPNPHRYTLSSDAFFSKDLFVLPCHYSGINIGMMGETNKVKAELARTELELLDMLEKSGIVDVDTMVEAIRIELGERKLKFLEGNKKALLAGMEAAK